MVGSIVHQLTKGASIEDLTQRRLNLMLSHINSVKRKKLGNRSPFDKLTQGELNDMKKLGLYPIDPKKVIMDKTKLFKILAPGYESKKQSLLLINRAWANLSFSGVHFTLTESKIHHDSFPFQLNIII